MEEGFEGSERTRPFLRSPIVVLVRPEHVASHSPCNSHSSHCQAKFKLQAPVDAKGAEREVWTLG